MSDYYYTEATCIDISSIALPDGFDVKDDGDGLEPICNRFLAVQVDMNTDEDIIIRLDSKYQKIQPLEISINRDAAQALIDVLSFIISKKP